MIRSAAGTSVTVSLCACEQVTSDFEGIAPLENYVAQKKNSLIMIRISLVRP